MSIRTLAQIAEKPMMVATDEAISNFADSRHGFLPMVFSLPNGVHSLPILLVSLIIIAAGLSDDNDVPMS
jgi:hypothetical protein